MEQSIVVESDAFTKDTKQGAARINEIVTVSDGTFVYAYDKRMCYFDTLTEKLQRIGALGTDTERNPINANTFNSAPLRVRTRNKHTVTIRMRK